VPERGNHKGDDEMNTYYVVYPREFANEYTVYAVNSKADALRFEGAYGSFFRVPRSEALRLGIQRPADAERDGEQWYGGFMKDAAFHALKQKPRYTIADQIEAVVVDTMRSIEMVEGERQRNADYAYDQRNAEYAYDQRNAR
jgi:hypothetical protein